MCLSGFIHLAFWPQGEERQNLCSHYTEKMTFPDFEPVIMLQCVGKTTVNVLLYGSNAVIKDRSEPHPTHFSPHRPAVLYSSIPVFHDNVNYFSLMT